MPRSNAELQWYLRHEWERRLARPEWAADLTTGRTRVRRERRS